MKVTKYVVHVKGELFNGEKVDGYFVKRWVIAPSLDDAELYDRLDLATKRTLHSDWRISGSSIKCSIFEIEKEITIVKQVS